jgi:hypothetical protein
MERVWTEKEPLVPEWSDHKEDKKEQTDGMPKLSLKLLYGMIQELKQSSEQLNARLDEFEHYMIEVQAARAQLEADAARTIARAKALAALHDRAALAEAAAAVQRSPVDLAAAAVHSSKEDCADIAAIEAVEPPAEEHSDLMNTVAAIINHSPTVVEPIVDNSSQAAEETQAIEAIPLHAKPGKPESQPAYLMTLAQEVLGITSDEDGDDGLDREEGANPFDPDSFAAHSVEAAEAQAVPTAALPAQHSAAAMTSPFFMPRSQRHQSSKKTFLSLFGFRTRIS